MFCSAILILAMLCAAGAHAQRRTIYLKDSISLCSVKKMTFSLDTTQMCSPAISVPFKHVRVVDVRFDTTMVDYFTMINSTLTVSTKNYKVTMEAPVGSSLTRLLSHYYKNNYTDEKDAELIIFLKKLNVASVDGFNQSDLYNYRKINFVAEAFLKKGNYAYAACKIDTVIQIQLPGSARKKYVQHIADSLIMPAINLLERKISNTDWTAVLQRKMFDTAFVYRHYCLDRFNLPILNEPYNKGVYKTAKEFVTNKPSITAFTVLEKAKGVDILEDAAGNTIPMLHYFGYCDGKICWIMTDVHASPLFRVGNTFEYFAHFNYRADYSLYGGTAFSSNVDVAFLAGLDLEN